METRKPSAEQMGMIQKNNLRQALKSWDSVQILGENPLCRLEIVRKQRLFSGYSDTPPGHGLALREILQVIIDSIKPEKTDPDYTQRMWRPYIILSEQFIHGRSPDYLAEQLFISRRTFYNEQEATLDMVISSLIQREEESGTSVTRTIAPSIPDIPAPAWLQIPFMTPPRPNNPMIGREEILSRLKLNLLHDKDGHDLVLQGLPGAGKTALIIELAHDSDILTRFKDGVLWVGLGCQPDPLMLLGFWASILGIPIEEIARQSTLSQRAQLVKTVIGTRHMLLIVDDVWTVEAANLFRLGGPNCACILTTRLIKIANEFSPESVIRIPELETPEGIRLLSVLVPLAVQPKLEEMKLLVEAVGGLPLALTLMGRHLRQQGSQSRRIQTSLKQLQEAQNRLLLSQPQSPLGQTATSSIESSASVTLQAVLEISYYSLPENARQALHALALFPPKPGSFSDQAAMAVLVDSIGDLDTLVDYGLLENVGIDRYTMHQVIADFASLNYPAPRQIEAFFNYWAQWTETHIDDYPQIDLEIHSIRRALQLSQKLNHPHFLTVLVLQIRQFLVVRGLYDECLYWIEQALNSDNQFIDTEGGGFLLLTRATIAGMRGQLDAAEAMIGQSLKIANDQNKPLLKAEALQGSADIHLQRGEYVTARNLYSEALAQYKAHSVLRGQAQCLRSMGVTYAEQGDYKEANDCYDQALDLFHRCEDERGESSALISMGGMLADQGRYGKAREHYKQALALKQKCHDLRGEGVLLNNLGIAALAQCQYDAARDYFTRSLAIRKEIGDLRGTGIVMGNLGVTMDRLGEYAQAKACFDNALTIYRQIGARNLEGRELSFLGLLFHHLGDQHAACERCEQSLRIAEEAGSRLVQGNALTYWGHALVELESLPEAIEVYRKALILRQESNQLQLSVDARAGMARVALMQNDPQNARRYMDEIWQQFQQDPLTGADEPLRAYATCYQIAKTLRDDQAEAILDQAIDLFQTQSREIADPHLHRTFMENIPTHRFLANMAAQKRARL